MSDSAIEWLDEQAVTLPARYAETRDCEVWKGWQGSLRVALNEIGRLVPLRIAKDYPKLPDWATVMEKKGAVEEDGQSSAPVKAEQSSTPFSDSRVAKYEPQEPSLSSNKDQRMASPPRVPPPLPVVSTYERRTGDQRGRSRSHSPLRQPPPKATVSPAAARFETPRSGQPPAQNGNFNRTSPVAYANGSYGDRGDERWRDGPSGQRARDASPFAPAPAGYERGGGGSIAERSPIIRDHRPPPQYGGYDRDQFRPRTRSPEFSRGLVNPPRGYSPPRDRGRREEPHGLRYPPSSFNHRPPSPPRVYNNGPPPPQLHPHQRPTSPPLSASETTSLLISLNSRIALLDAQHARMTIVFREPEDWSLAIASLARGLLEEQAGLESARRKRGDGEEKVREWEDVLERNGCGVEERRGFVLEVLDVLDGTVMPELEVSGWLSGPLELELTTKL